LKRAFNSFSVGIDAMNEENHIALVTGANRGLGFEISRQLGKRGLTVLMGARNERQGAEAARELQDEGLDVRAVQLNVTRSEDIERIGNHIENEFGRLDVLVNNAAVLLDINVQPSQVEESVLRQSFEVNFFGPFLLTQRMAPLLKKSARGRIVNMDTGVASLAQLADPDSPLKDDICPAYQTSKAALNALTLVFAKELREDGIKVNSACPGWVMTDMGHEDLPDYGDAARPKTPEEGVDTPVWLATLPDDGPTGGFYSDRKPRAW
jgi:NAD(P)-dependent dehydrogenase (short-subunit alcohol dehydrogenase family)